MYFVVLWETWSAVIPGSWLRLECENFKWPPKKCKNPALESRQKTVPDDTWETIYYKKYFGPFGKHSLHILVF